MAESRCWQDPMIGREESWIKYPYTVHCQRESNYGGRRIEHEKRYAFRLRQTECDKKSLYNVSADDKSRPRLGLIDRLCISLVRRLRAGSALLLAKGYTYVVLDSVLGIKIQTQMESSKASH